MKTAVNILFASLLSTTFAQNEIWKIYSSTNNNLADNKITAVIIDKNNNKWIGSQEGLTFFDGKNWKTLSKELKVKPNVSGLTSYFQELRDRIELENQRLSGTKPRYKKDSKELRKETLRERLKHHQDAIENIKSEIAALEKDESEDKSDVQMESEGAKTKEQFDKIDKKELKEDTKKQKVQHEKDAIKDDDSKIKNLNKGKPSAKKKRRKESFEEGRKI